MKTNQVISSWGY